MGRFLFGERNEAGDTILMMTLWPKNRGGGGMRKPTR